eukprot:m.1564232 g.1564232  ORF g.1564232 m.1564232 type:complete len:477 (-) comp25284_c0_seq2:9413-10843(-)
MEPTVRASAALSTASTLPQHWVSKTSSRYPNRRYYYNTKTGETSWDRPQQPHCRKSSSSGVGCNPRFDVRAHSHEDATITNAQHHTGETPTAQGIEVRGGCTEQGASHGARDGPIAVPMDVDETAVLEAYRGYGQREMHSAKSTGVHFGRDIAPVVDMSPSSPRGMDLDYNTLFVVLDTSFLLVHLDYLHELCSATILDGALVVTLVVPDVVLQELDGLKGGDAREQAGGDAFSSVARNARKAISWVHSALVQPEARVRGEPFADARRALTLFGPDDRSSSVSNDDKVLFCAQFTQFVLAGGTRTDAATSTHEPRGMGSEHALVGVAEGVTQAKVVVFTNDRNMANRALINGLSVCDRTSRPHTSAAVLACFASAAEMDAGTFHAARELHLRGVVAPTVRGDGPDHRRGRPPEVSAPSTLAHGGGGPKVFCSCSLFSGLHAPHDYTTEKDHQEMLKSQAELQQVAEHDMDIDDDMS